MKDRLFRFKHFRNRFILRILSEQKLLQNAQSLCNLVQIAFFFQKRKICLHFNKSQTFKKGILRNVNLS